MLKRRRNEVEIPTSSTADIAFLLIVFFMLTSVFSETMGLRYELPPPDDDETEATQPDPAVSIRILASGSVLADKTPVDAVHMKRDLLAYLGPKLSRNPSKPVLISAEEQSPYGRFVEVYDALLRVDKQLNKNRVESGKRTHSMKLMVLSINEVRRLEAQHGVRLFSSSEG